MSITGRVIHISLVYMARIAVMTARQSLSPSTFLAQHDHTSLQVTDNCANIEECGKGGVALSYVSYRLGSKGVDQEDYPPKEAAPENVIAKGWQRWVVRIH
jgi:hypothetical protein